eukprot:gene20194-biopygen1027
MVLKQQNVCLETHHANVAGAPQQGAPGSLLGNLGNLTATAGPPMTPGSNSGGGGGGGGGGGAISTVVATSTVLAMVAVAAAIVAAVVAASRPESFARGPVPKGLGKGTKRR